MENLKAYQEGNTSCLAFNGDPKAVENPYETDTPEWRSWNRGWNDALDCFL